METPAVDVFLKWVKDRDIEVIVWDMDCTISAGHCGAGLVKANLSEYIAGTSTDFVAAVTALVAHNEQALRPIRCAVATGSDPKEYDLPGQSKDTHILGPDLATALISEKCPHAMPLFDIMIGYDCRLHTDEHDENINYQGKRHHMRTIQQHFNVPFSKMVLIDDSPSSLVNEDGWLGIKVNGEIGFCFEHCGV